MTAAMHLSMPWEEYCAGGYLGSSALHSWGKMSLEGWSAEHLESAYSGSSSPYMAAGSALDALLTGDPSGKRLAVKPEGMSFATKDGKAWKAEHDGCEIITAEQYAEIKAALPKARQAIEVFRRLHKAEPIYQATLRGEVDGVLVQTRPDIMVGPAVPDLKYVNSDAFDRFDRTFVGSRYFLQAGLFYGLGQEAGISDPLVSFLLVESGTVYPRCRVAEVPRNVLEAGWERVRTICREIAEQRERGFLDVVDFRPLSIPTWAEANL